MPKKADYKNSKKLTRRELQVLQLIARCRKTQQIANELNISPRTVESHRQNAYSKMRFSGASDVFDYFDTVNPVKIGVIININYPVDFSRSNIAVCI